MLTPAQQTMPPTCENCRFARKLRDSRGQIVMQMVNHTEFVIRHYCRRYPPQRMPSGEGSFFPIVDGDEWCGEHDPC